MCCHAMAWHPDHLVSMHFWQEEWGVNPPPASAHLASSAALRPEELPRWRNFCSGRISERFECILAVEEETGPLDPIGILPIGKANYHVHRIGIAFPCVSWRTGASQTLGIHPLRLSLVSGPSSGVGTTFTPVQKERQWFNDAACETRNNHWICCKRED